MNFGRRLSKAREAAGLTQKQLAELVGVSQQAINKLEKRAGVGSRYTAQLAAACKVSPDWLATGKAPMASQVDLREVSTEAHEVARAFLKLSPALQSSVRTLIYSMASAQAVARWLVIEPPKTAGYSAWEKAIQSAYDAEIKQLKLDIDP